MGCKCFFKQHINVINLHNLDLIFAFLKLEHANLFNFILKILNLHYIIMVIIVSAVYLLVISSLEILTHFDGIFTGCVTLVLLTVR